MIENGNKLLSIIIPVYNRPEKLRYCMDEILKVSGTEYEVILVDDCSADMTPEVCDEYERRYENKVSVIHLSQNKGPGNARNIATENAKGKYLFYVDSDDEIYSENLSHFLETSNEWIDSDIICFSYTVGYMDKDGEVSKELRLHEKMRLSLEGFLELKTYWINTNVWRYIFSNDMVRCNNIMFPNYRILEDAHFVLNAFACTKTVRLVEECLYHHNYNVNDSLTGRISFEEMLSAANNTLSWIIHKKRKLFDSDTGTILLKRAAIHVVQLVALADSEKFKLICDEAIELSGIMSVMANVWKKLWDALSDKSWNFSKPVYIYPGGKAARRLAEKIFSYGGSVDGFIDNYRTRAIIETDSGSTELPCIKFSSEKLSSPDAIIVVASFNEAREPLVEKLVDAGYYIDSDMQVYKKV